MSHVNHPGDLALLEAISRHTDVGYLGIVTPDGYPRVVPVNFALLGDRIYFHGATRGEKFEVFQSEPKVTFCIAVPYAQLPSHWRSPEYACPATQYFKSVLIRGRGVLVSDTVEKATALQALMEKHQPEGKYRKITATEPLYTKAIPGVAIFRIDPDRIDIRTKFGDQLSRETRLKLIAKLRERREPMDLETAAEMEARLENQSAGEAKA